MSKSKEEKKEQPSTLNFAINYLLEKIDELNDLNQKIEKIEKEKGIKAPKLNKKQGAES